MTVPHRARQDPAGRDPRPGMPALDANFCAFVGLAGAQGLDQPGAVLSYIL
jgi:hypothetical protein